MGRLIPVLIWEAIGCLSIVALIYSGLWLPHLMQPEFEQPYEVKE